MEKNGQPKIFNTDQGSQFTSKNFIKELTKREIKISMNGKGRALDNVQKMLLLSYITFYNQKRMHQSLQYLTPEQVYLTKTIV